MTCVYLPVTPAPHDLYTPAPWLPPARDRTSTRHYMTRNMPVPRSQVFLKLGTPPVPINALPANHESVTPGTEVSVGAVLFAKVETKEALEKQVRNGCNGVTAVTASKRAE